jgi:hypothetical protein
MSKMESVSPESLQKRLNAIVAEPHHFDAAPDLALARQNIAPALAPNPFHWPM